MFPLSLLMQLLAGVGISAAAVQEPEFSSRRQYPHKRHVLGAVSQQNTYSGDELKYIFYGFLIQGLIQLD